MKSAFSAKKVALVSGAVVAAAAVSLTAYALMSNPSEDSFLGALSSAVNPAKTMATQLSATGDVKTSDYISASQIAVTGDGKYAFVNDETAQKVYKLDLSTNKKVAEAAVGAQVNNVVVNGNDVYVLYGALDGKVAKYTTDLKAAGDAVSVGHTPSDGVVNGSELYVSNRFTNNVSVINTSTMKVTKTIDVSREPMALTIASNKLFVACHLQDSAATDKVVSAKVSVIDLASQAKIKDIALPNGSEGVKDICSSPDGKYVYATHILARYGYPTTQLDRGWINTNAVSIIKADSAEHWNTVLLDRVEKGSGNPWGVAATNDKLIVSVSGTQEAVVIDRAAMEKKITDVESGKAVVRTLDSAAKIKDYVNFLDGTRTYVSLPGQNPRGMAVYGNKAYFAQYISGDVAVLNLADNTTSTISLGTQPEQDIVRHGEELWYDATNCYQNWESCASCHPDARMDSINWDNLNDGLGNPKSAKSMLYSHRTPPTMITGIRASAEIAVRAGMKYIQFNTVSEDENLAIDEFLKSLKPEQSPYLNKDGSLTEDALKGKKLFEDNCASCHSGPFFTDLEHHATNVPYAENWETKNGQKYVTPSLVEVWRTAPYGFNGSYKSIRDYVDAALKGKTNAEKDQLTQYVLSIGAEGEEYGLEQVQVTNNGALTANKLIPGSRIDKVTFRKQLDTANDAVATFELFDNTGKSLAKKTLELSHTMNDRKAASVDINFDVPESLKADSYFKVSIVSKADQNKKLATDFVAKYKG